MTDIELGEAYTWAAARAAGATRGQIRRDGVRLGKGLYLSSAAEPDLRTRCAAWAPVLPDDAAFGLWTAAELLGAPARRSSVHVVLSPRLSLPRRAGLVVHARGIAAADVVDLDGLAVTSGPQTWLDLAPLLPPQELVAVGDALMRGGHLTADDLAARLARAGGLRGVVRARECAPLLDGRAASRPESLTRYWLVTSDLPALEIQMPVHDRWGREVVHADLGWSRWRVAVEYEGRQHADHDQFGRDLDRYSLMAADGWLLLRFAARHVDGPTVVVERCRRALLSRGWRPDSP
ncbi:hypothetical protein [Geodermatophilus marinus]|uniref:hypothetical protein n=1 Tax=Geodermatophilus sp. LHW52908 TaxID=2303986 RepID=UPI000E3E13C4|nr:hypothetical protein [Geodermatophilus sp. LHW52908]RFU21325.1 hypothetical protein D0Z06_11105 [Geodermatophilus sp. LHW52908]